MVHRDVVEEEIAYHDGAGPRKIAGGGDLVMPHVSEQMREEAVEKVEDLTTVPHVTYDMWSEEGEWAQVEG